MDFLQSLPTELTGVVLDQLPFADTVQLSMTCKAFRQFLAPRIFKAIRVPSSAKGSESALATVKVHGIHTIHVAFVGTAGGEDERISPALPAAAAKLLAGDDMPNMRSVTMHFPFDLENTEDWDGERGTIYVWERSEDEDGVKEAEEEYQWRALMNEAWCAVSKNMNVKDLVIDRFLPKWTSAFRTDDFHAFLSRLETVKISIQGFDNGAGWKSNTVEGYGNSIAEIFDVFFRHTAMVKKLTLIASPNGPLGEYPDGFHTIPFPLEADHLPQLQDLTLGNCFIEPEMFNFIEAHQKTLRRLDLSGCVATETAHEEDDELRVWHDFLSKLRDLQLPMLVAFSAGGIYQPTWENSDPEMKRDRWDGLAAARDWTMDMINRYGLEEDELNEKDEHVQLFRFVRANPHKQALRYAYLDDKYGMFFTFTELTLENMQMGRDQKAYDDLIDYVGKNAARLGL